MPENQVFNFNYYQLCYNYYDQSLDMIKFIKNSSLFQRTVNQTVGNIFCKKIPANPDWICQPDQEQRMCGHALCQTSGTAARARVRDNTW